MNTIEQTRKAFKERAVQWLKHKIILSYNSRHYKDGEPKEAIRFIRDHLGDFLIAPSTYCSAKVSHIILNNLQKVKNALPSRGNPSYDNQERILNLIIEDAQKIVMYNNYESQKEKTAS